VEEMEMGPKKFFSGRWRHRRIGLGPGTAHGVVRSTR